MVVRSFEVGKNPFCHKEEHEKLLGLEVSFLSVIGALIYLTNCMTKYSILSQPYYKGLEES